MLIAVFSNSSVKTHECVLCVYSCRHPFRSCSYQCRLAWDLHMLFLSTLCLASYCSSSSHGLAGYFILYYYY